MEKFNSENQQRIPWSSQCLCFVCCHSRLWEWPQHKEEWHQLDHFDIFFLDREFEHQKWQTRNMRRKFKENYPKSFAFASQRTPFVAAKRSRWRYLHSQWERNAYSSQRKSTNDPRHKIDLGSERKEREAVGEREMKREGEGERDEESRRGRERIETDE